MPKVVVVMSQVESVCPCSDSFGADAYSIDSEEKVPMAVKFLTARSQGPRIVELKVDPEDLPPLNLEGSLMF